MRLLFSKLDNEDLHLYGPCLPHCDRFCHAVLLLRHV